MQRREFITLLGSAAAAWPLAAWAQQPARMRRIGVLMPEAANDAQSPARSKAFEQGLVQLGRVPGRDIEIEYRWADGDIERARVATTELLALKPDAIVAVASMALKVVKQATSTIPVVFVAITEPVAQGFVASLARPGGNLTGFTFMEVTFAEKWIELLKEIAPGVMRGAVMFNPDTTGNFAGFVRTAEAVAQKFAMELTTAPVRQLADVETAMTTLAREPGGGLVLLPDPFIVTNRKAIIEAATRHLLPAIAGFKSFVADGLLVSYGVDVPDLCRLAAGYVDRILKGEKPADLAVQQPVKFELAINLNTARALKLTIPQTLLVSADEVIE
jgi:putative tryptophan/tyrosine transport system substrate-binding protein